MRLVEPGGYSSRFFFGKGKIREFRLLAAKRASAAPASHCEGLQQTRSNGARKGTSRLEPTSSDPGRWWFALSQCNDGTYYYQPNRDNAGYGADSRLTISAVVAFLFSLERKNLALSGR
ncbi:MAG: hypothetical protein JNM84_08270 [Planctomycetes bacterium]|nr:hypothetical protein [Planctomycetota bacterium]